MHGRKHDGGKYHRLEKETQREYHIITDLQNRIYERKLGRLNQEKDRTNSFTWAYILAVIIISGIITMAATWNDVYMLISCTAVLLAGISMVIGVYVRHVFNLDVFIAVNKGVINDEGNTPTRPRHPHRDGYARLKSRATLMPRMELQDIIEMS
jgi:hypothetical protein